MKKDKKIYVNKIFLSFLVCIIYWTYLIFNADFLLVHDAIGYDALGRMVAEKGWLEFFRTGPNREPVYIALIVTSMKLESLTAISYHYFQKIFQLVFLFSSQILMFKIMRRIKINEWIISGIILYVGISPALLNAALSLYSEIAAFPFVLAVLFSLMISWEKILKESSISELARLAVLTAVCFVCAILSKGIFMYVFYAICCVFILLGIMTFFMKKKGLAKAIFSYCFVLFFVGMLLVSSYKMMNQVYNGKFELTNRYAGALFGQAYKRSNPVTPRIIMAHLASIPGWGSCRAFFSETECQYCEFYVSDLYWMGATLQEQLKVIPKDLRYKKTKELALQKIFEHPFKFIMFMGFEAPKVLFWESTQIGFVQYPSWLSNLYNKKMMRWGLRFLMFILTAMSSLWSVFFLMKKRILLFSNEEGSQFYHVLFFTFIVIFPFAGLYSMFLILTRYALPVAPLFLIVIAIFTHIGIGKINGNKPI